MLNSNHITLMIRKQWFAEPQKYLAVNTDNVKFITGDLKHDSHLHYLATVYGLEIQLNSDFSKMIGYTVVNEKKFSMFLLKWA